MKKYLTKLLKTKTAKKYFDKFKKSKIGKKVGAVLIILAGLFGYSLSTEQLQNLTAEQIYTFISQNGGTYIEEKVMSRPQLETGTPSEEKQAEPEIVNGTRKLPKWSEVKKDITYDRTRRQKYGSCVFESYDILMKENLLKKGFKIDKDKSFIDIDHSYWQYSYKPHTDSGSVPMQVFNRFSTTGLPVRLTDQTTAENSRGKPFTYLRDKINQEVYNEKYNVKLDLKIKKRGYSASELIATLKKGELFRISVNNYKDIKGNRCVSFYWTKTPFIKSGYETDFYSKCKRSGGHSIAGVPIGVFEFNGEPHIAINDSTGDSEIRLMSESVLRKILTSYEIYEPTTATEEPKVKSNLEEYEKTILKTQTIRYGQRGETVKVLQKYLGVTQDGVYGNQTRQAMIQWQIKNLGRSYGGKLWGTLSKNKFVKLSNNML